MSDDIDRWVHEKFELGHTVNPPELPQVDGFSDFLADVQRTGDDYATDCALTLLDLRLDGRKGFMEMIAQANRNHFKTSPSIHLVWF